MSSASTTQYYGLTQYIGTDKPSFLDNNEAFAAVDAALHGAVTDVASQGETIGSLSETVGTLGETVTGLGNDLNTEKGKIVALQNKEELQDTAIAGVKTAALDMICAYTEASATSTHAYAIDDYFRYQDVLYQATSAIEIGDTIVPNVNCSATNVSEELLAQAGEIDDIKSALPKTFTVSGANGDTFADVVQKMSSAIRSLGLSTERLMNMKIYRHGVTGEVFHCTQATSSVLKFVAINPFVNGTVSSSTLNMDSGNSLYQFFAIAESNSFTPNDYSALDGSESEFTITY